MKILVQKRNKHNKNNWKSIALLCLISMSFMFITGCTNGKNNIASTPNQEQKPDSVPGDLRPTASETTDSDAPSIFEKLTSDMVHVEGDTLNFYICKYEVTQELWEEVMKENPSQMQGDNLPVEQISWDDCQLFIGKLNELTGKKYRLPTEVEWEYACRGGKYSKGYAYSGSNDIEEVAWYDGNSEDRTHPVGKKKPNELGLYDMSGNVWEWCQDLLEYSRVCRGGSWIHNARNCDPSLRNETPQSFTINSLGLRLASDSR